ncbi:MAG TPA: DUF1080 domain-containing protein [Armatimonadota bacterium]
MPHNPGYTDTPMIPGMPYRVHDAQRPQPPVVQPGTESTQDRPGTPPSDAVCLFDGTNLDAWQKSGGGEPGWRLVDGAMEVEPHSGSIETKEHFGDCQLHIEWASPSEVKGEDQGRGNSGVFLMGRYEIQVLDCYKNITYADGLAGAMYGQYPPLVNASRKPGEWQSFDVLWQGPRFEGDQLTRPARVTLLHNGVVIHNATELKGPTRHRDAPHYEPQPEVGPIGLQDHGDLVRFRNIWIRPLKGYDEG